MILKTFSGMWEGFINLKYSQNKILGINKIMNQKLRLYNQPNSPNQCTTMYIQLNNNC